MERTLTIALDSHADHLSCYALTVEPGTELFRRVAAGAPAPDADAQAEQWELADVAARNAGLVRYEVSNWARPGHAVRYNLAVWAQAEYLAYGLGAHRFRRSVRSHNFRHLDTYHAAMEQGKSASSGQESIRGGRPRLERVFLVLDGRRESLRAPPEPPLPVPTRGASWPNTASLPTKPADWWLSAPS